jgi:hypothetical protein
MFYLLRVVFCCFALSDLLIVDAVEPNPNLARGQSEFAMLLERKTRRRIISSSSVRIM